MDHHRKDAAADAGLEVLKDAPLGNYGDRALAPEPQFAPLGEAAVGLAEARLGQTQDRLGRDKLNEIRRELHDALLLGQIKQKTFAAFG
jgi:hypothetical protein